MSRVSSGEGLVSDARPSLLVRCVCLLDDCLWMLPGIRFAHIPASLDASVSHPVVGRLLGGLRRRRPPIERHWSSLSAPEGGRHANSTTPPVARSGCAPGHGGRSAIPPNLASSSLRRLTRKC